jgi:hypothetical protein
MRLVFLRWPSDARIPDRAHCWVADYIHPVKNVVVALIPVVVQGSLCIRDEAFCFGLDVFIFGSAFEGEVREHETAGDLEVIAFPGPQLLSYQLPDRWQACSPGSTEHGPAQENAGFVSSTRIVGDQPSKCRPRFGFTEGELLSHHSCADRRMSTESHRQVCLLLIVAVQHVEKTCNLLVLRPHLTVRKRASEL